MKNFSQITVTLRQPSVNSFSFLSEFIFKATRKNTIILIDEYDTHLTHAYQNNFLNEISSFLRNLKIYTLLDNKYRQYFGFTENEVIELTTQLATTHSLDEIRQFYNGYIIGSEQAVYNPWSLMSYFDEGNLVPYWILTSGDGLLKKLFLNTSCRCFARSKIMIYQIAFLLYTLRFTGKGEFLC